MIKQDYSDVTIILQGLLHPEVDLIKTVKHYVNLGFKVVVSIYRRDYASVKELEQIKNVSVCLNNLIDYEKELDHIKSFFPPPLREELSLKKEKRNRFFQYKTTYAALKEVKTKYFIKSRVDSYFEKINVVADYGIELQKPVSISLFVRGMSFGIFKMRFHLSDICFFGETKKFISVYKNLTDIFNPMIPEANLWSTYIKINYSMNDKFLNAMPNEKYLNFMCENFYVVPVDYLYPYKIKFGKIVLKELTNDIKTTKEYLINGCDQKNGWF